MDLQLADKIVMVTGATGGIGGAICRSFLQEGSAVVPVYRGPFERLQPLLEWAGDAQIATDRIVPAAIELSDPGSTRRGVDAVMERFGRVDVLVNCAGHALEMPFLLTDDEQWNQVIDVNLSAVARITRLVAKHMFKARSGAVVNVSSILGSRFGRGVVGYSVAKAGLVRFSEALALEVGSRGVRVNTVCPGVIDTPMSRNLNVRMEHRLHDLMPLRRPGQPDEVSGAVMFLSSARAASYITGATVVVDGGLRI
jgi:3-oxoacyl-[acyl-carrier protein] reductase